MPLSGKHPCAIAYFRDSDEVLVQILSSVGKRDRFVRDMTSPKWDIFKATAMFEDDSLKELLFTSCPGCDTCIKVQHIGQEHPEKVKWVRVEYP